jgi:hypothetical protein
MKPSKIILSLALLFLTVISVRAQDCQCPEEVQDNKTVLKVIGVNDYVNFLNIEGLQKYSNINYEQFDLESNKVRRYILNNHGKNMAVKATYGKDGNLMKGSLITKNSRLPKVIQNYLVTGNYEGWTMTSNKTVVRDFNALNTEYEVKIKRDTMKQTLYFDHLGNRITRLTRS